MTGESVEAVEILEILRLLPHRYPFVMIDRIIEIRGDDSCIGIKNVTINEPQFLGHFPENPVMPGVLLIEGMAQTGAVIVLRLLKLRESHAMFLLTIDKAKFRRPAMPGDRIEYHLTKLRNRRGMWWYRAEAKVEGKLICEAEVGAMLGEART
ncbi:MAG: 3-hydroxyacyl-ACP dehydratase FabZ [Xanthobacteraceae bacterium]|jgi:3-hydroxyacyl-[acyl-carrier-protein] dehydratase